MNLTARVLWVALSVAVVAGGVVVGSAFAARSDAEEELMLAEAKRARLQQESDRLDDRMTKLAFEQADRHTFRKDCFLQLLRRIGDWNQLIEDIPTVIYSSSDLEPYSAQARELLLDARQYLSICREG